MSEPDLRPKCPNCGSVSYIALCPKCSTSPPNALLPTEEMIWAGCRAVDASPRNVEDRQRIIAVWAAMRALAKPDEGVVDLMRRAASALEDSDFQWKREIGYELSSSLSDNAGVR